MEEITTASIKTLTEHALIHPDDANIRDLVRRGLVRPNAAGSYMLTPTGKACWAAMVQAAKEFCSSSANDGDGAAELIAAEESRKLLGQLVADLVTGRLPNKVLAKKFMEAATAFAAHCGS